MKIALNSKIVDICVSDTEQILVGQTYGEIVDALIRQKYSVSAELAILRQRNEKPEEFAEYYQYCEECKRKARGEV